MIKKILPIIFAVFFIPAAAGALVFETTSAAAEIIAPKIEAQRLDSAEVRINGKNVQLKRYSSGEPVKKILEALLDKAEKQGNGLVNNQYLWLAANALFKGASSGFEPDSFGYIFAVDKKDTAVFVVAGASGGRTEIIKTEIQNYSGKTAQGYMDGINHFLGAKKVLSIEFLSGGKTVNFGNFYSVAGAGRLEIRAYYNGEFKKTGWLVLKKEYAKEADLYVLKGKNGEVFLNISEQENGGMCIFVMG